MTEAEKTVFISYRRSTSKYIAAYIHRDLQDNGYDVFRDITSIDSGAFDKVILHQIAAKMHFIVILTPGTLERCSEPGDWLRREIEEAMYWGRNIVPLIMEGFNFKDDESLLTGKLANLPRYNALPVPYEYLEEAMLKLRTRFLKKPEYPVEIVPTPSSERAEVIERIVEAASQPSPTKEELTAEQYYHRGVANRLSGDSDAALNDFTESIRLNPHVAASYTLRGAIHFMRNEIEKAIADSDEAIRLDPKLEHAFLLRGMVHASQNDFHGAIADYDEAIRLNPQLGEAYNNRGETRHRQGDLNGAIADYDEAIRLNEKDVDSHFSRGFIRYKQGDLNGAIADYDEAICLDPKDGYIYSFRGIAHLRKGNPHDAVPDFNEAIRLMPNNDIGYISRGEAFFALNQFDHALVDFKKADKLHPAFNYTLAGLAVTYHVLGNIEDAKQLWQSLVTQDEHYLDAAWLKKEWNWVDALVDEAKKLIARL